MDIYKQIKIKLRTHGATCRILSADHIPKLESEINLLYKNPIADKDFL